LSDQGLPSVPKNLIFGKIVRNIFTPRKLNPLFRNVIVPTSGAGFMFVVGWQKVRVQGEECRRPANWRVCCSRWEEFSCFTHIPQQGCWKCRLRHNLEIFEVTQNTRSI